MKRFENLKIEKADAFRTFRRENPRGSFYEFNLDWSRKLAERSIFGDLGGKGSTGEGVGIATVNSPDDARKLAPGTRFKTPDGREFVR